MQEVIVDFSKYPDIAAFHDDIAQRLDFPAHYGHNLDALNDCLREIPPESVHFTIFYGGSGIPHKQQVTIAKILLNR